MSQKNNLTDYGYLERNVNEVIEKIKKAALECGRSTDDITFLAAIKSADTDEIVYICDKLGVRCIGENRVQQLTGRYPEIKRDGVELHFIGKLQRNKVKYIIDKVDLIHSVDNAPLALEISSRALRACRVMDVLVEINIGREEDKSGVMPEDAAELADFISELEGVNLRGFMTMAPACESVEEYRKYFSEMRRISLDIWQNRLGRDSYPVLSMGMSDSFEAAILEGATIVRVGRRLFKNEQ